MRSGRHSRKSLVGDLRACQIWSRPSTRAGNTAICHQPFGSLSLASIATRLYSTRARRESSWLPSRNIVVVSIAIAAVALLLLIHWHGLIWTFWVWLWN